MRIIDRLKREGRRVESFISWCGGLPEPSASNVGSTAYKTRSDVLKVMRFRYRWDTSFPGVQRLFSQRH
jgi:hypothetical protein